MNQAQIFNFLDDVDHYNPQNAFIVKLPSGITSRDQLLQLLYEKLKLPEYFGFNWDALFECLRDFHWINEKLIVLVHKALPSLEDKTLTVYLEILSDSCLDWKPGEDHKFEVVFPEADRKKISTLLSRR